MVKSWSSWAERDERNSEDHYELKASLTGLGTHLYTPVIIIIIDKILADRCHVTKLTNGFKIKDCIQEM